MVTFTHTCCRCDNTACCRRRRRRRRCCHPCPHSQCRARLRLAIAPLHPRLFVLLPVSCAFCAPSCPLFLRRAQRFAPTNMLARLCNLSRRGLSSSSHAVAAAAKEAPVPPSLWKIFHGISPIAVPMDQPFPGVPPLVGVPSTPISTQITKLPNGVSVVTDNRPGLLASVAVFSRSGSCIETDATSGSAFVQQRAALKDTSSRSHFNIIRCPPRPNASSAEHI